jgi:hypothetical protein
VVGGPLTLRITLPICLLLIAATTAGCEPVSTITYVNETDKTILIYIADDADLSEYDIIIQPHSTELSGTMNMNFKGVVIGRDEEGNLLFRKRSTWDDLKAQGFRITDDMLSPTPTGGP